MNRRQALLLNGGRPSVGPIQPFTLAELRRVRSSLFTARGSVPMGPRPGQPDNCITWGEYVNGHYGPDAGQICFDVWKQRGYTHAACGPFVDDGYHGQFPPTTFADFERRQDEFLDRINAMRRARIIPVAFIGVDNWSLSDMQKFNVVFRQPKWQDALQMVVPHGWEPSKDTPNSEWVAWSQWGADLFPKAMRLIHMPSDMDTPGNNDDLTPGSPSFIGPAECWRRVAPYIGMFFAQYGPFYVDPVQAPAQVAEWEKVARDKRFQNGHAGWPTFSQYGNTPIVHVLAEYCSYPAWWNNLQESVCQEWGDIALRAGAEGVCDGCTLV